jgi:hypothetical protein
VGREEGMRRTTHVHQKCGEETCIAPPDHPAAVIVHLKSKSKLTSPQMPEMKLLFLNNVFLSNSQESRRIYKLPGFVLNVLQTRGYISVL